MRNSQFVLSIVTLLACSVASAGAPRVSLKARAAKLCLPPAMLPELPKGYKPWKKTQLPGSDRVTLSQAADLKLAPGIVAVRRVSNSGKTFTVISSACSAVKYNTSTNGSSVISKGDGMPQLPSSVQYDCMVRCFAAPKRARQAFNAQARILAQEAQTARTKLYKVKPPDGIDSILHIASTRRQGATAGGSRIYLVLAGPLVARLQMSFVDFDAGNRKSGTPAMIGRKGVATFNRWVHTLAAPSPAVIVLDTPNKPPAATGKKYDKWTFSQGDDLVITGQLFHRGRPAANTKVGLLLVSPNKGRYDLRQPKKGARRDFRGRTWEVGVEQRPDLKPDIVTDEKGRFHWRAFFAPHATVGHWTIKAQATVIDPGDKSEHKAESSRKAQVIEDPGLTASRLKMNFQWIQSQWKRRMPKAGPIQKLGAIDKIRAGHLNLMLRLPAWAKLGHKARTWGPINNIFASRHGGAYVRFTCGGISAQTLDLLNGIRYSPHKAIRKRMLGIAYMPVTHWPTQEGGASKTRDAMYNHIAIMLYYHGYRRLGMSTNVLIRNFRDHVFPLVKRIGFTSPTGGVVFEYWLNQQPDIMSVADWTKTFTAGHLGIAPKDWRELCPIPDWEHMVPKPSGPGNYVMSRLFPDSAGYSVGALRLAARRMEILTLSPVLLLATDERGRQTGLNSKGEILQAIPGSSVEYWPDQDGSISLRLLLPPGALNLKVTGKSKGKFGLVMNLPQRGRTLYFPKKLSMAPGRSATFRLAGNEKSANLAMPDGTSVKPQVLAEKLPKLKIDPAAYRVAAPAEEPGTKSTDPGRSARARIDALRKAGLISPKRPEKPKPKPKPKGVWLPNPMVGAWARADRSIFKATRDGRLLVGEKQAGRYVWDGKRGYRLTWSNGTVEKITVSDDAKTYNGTDNRGRRAAGMRIGKPPPGVVARPALR